jgi:hypothetical protein
MHRRKAMWRHQKISTSKPTGEAYYILVEDSVPEFTRRLTDLTSEYCWVCLEWSFNAKILLGAEAHACNPSYSGGRNWEDGGLRTARAKSSWDPHLNQWLGMMTHICHPSYCGKHKQEDHSLGQPGQKARPYLQNNQSKKGWGRASSSTAPAWQASSS